MTRRHDRGSGGDDAPATAGREIAIEVSGPVGAVPVQAWMVAPETRAVIEALSAAGDEVRFIGGCVRDAVLKRPVKDIDLALALPPQRVMALLTQAGIRAIPTGIAHGTVTAVTGSVHFEITTLRVDVETFGRHARVAFTDDWQADAARRDFTINALSCGVDGRIFDYFGGLDDLAVGRVRFVGDAESRLREDALRLLRFFRFYADYGRPPPDDDALAACRKYAPELRRLSGERVRGELLRILLSADPAAVLRLMRDHGVLAEVLPEADGFDRLDRLTWIESRALRSATVAPDPTRRLAALIGLDGTAAEAVARRLKFSNRERRRLTVAAGRRDLIDPEGDPVALKRALRHLGPVATRDLALIGWAGELAAEGRLPRRRTDAWLAVLDEIDRWRPIDFPLRGRDALALGVPPGREVSRLLDRVEDWWEADGMQASRAECLARLEAECRAAAADR
jgi:poly(A) polymerase